MADIIRRSLFVMAVWRSDGKNEHWYNRPIVISIECRLQDDGNDWERLDALNGSTSFTTARARAIAII
jgi:hypothetical protein